MRREPPHNGARPGGGTGAGLESGRAAHESEAHGTAGLLTGSAPAVIDTSGVAVLDAELGEVVDDLLAERRTVWGGAGR